MARQFDVTIEGTIPVVNANGLNSNKAIDFSGSPGIVLPVGLTMQNSVTSLGTTQNSVPTAAQLVGGIVTQTGSTGAGTVTLPLGTLLSAAMSTIAVGYSFECLFANLGGGQTLTITGTTGTTVIGTAAVPTGKNAQMSFVSTGTGTWNVYVIVSA